MSLNDRPNIPQLELILSMSLLNVLNIILLNFTAADCGDL